MGRKRLSDTRFAREPYRGAARAATLVPSRLQPMTGIGRSRPAMLTDKPTSFDIAQRAGVSQPTVSRALRGDPTVSEATRKRIEAIAAQLNYKVDKNASSLRSRPHQHAGAAVLRGSDPRRFADQPVLPVDAGIDRADLRAARLRPADLVPAALVELARRLRGQPQGRRDHPARLRRLRDLPRAARAARWRRARISCAGDRSSRASRGRRSAATMSRRARRRART